MIVSKGLTIKDNCPKCGTKTLELDNEGDIHCWACGTTFQKDESNNHDKLFKRHQFYENNKTAILGDVQSIGKSATAKKWGLNIASLYHVLKRWEREAKEKEMKTSEPTNIQARNEFYEDNKAAIIADLLKLGKPATRRKWRIPKGSLPRLIEKWLTPEQKAIVDSVGLEPTTKFAKNGQLPALPEFSNDWEASVQVTWLQIYGELLDRHSSENVW